MSKRNKAVKLTRRKIKYIIRSKINNKSTKKDCRRDEGKHLYGKESLDILARESRGSADKEIRKKEVDSKTGFI